MRSKQGAEPQKSKVIIDINKHGIRREVYAAGYKTVYKQRKREKNKVSENKVSENKVSRETNRKNA